MRKLNNQETSQSKSDVDQLLEALSRLKEEHKGFKYAYVLENEEDSASPEKKIDKMFIQTPLMSNYYR